MNSRFNIVGLGEVLFDILPTGKMLGGAPANFAYVATKLGNRGIIASRIGNDKYGGQISQTLENKGVDAFFLQIDEVNETGTVKVSLENGQPTYEITENVAWDFLELSEDWKSLAKTCDAVCFGTLAQRNSNSRRAIRGFINLTKPECLRVFDVNLRQDYYTIDILKNSLEAANIVKLNHEELSAMAAIFGLKGVNLSNYAKDLCERFDLKAVCVTRGGNGSLIVTADEKAENPGVEVEIADTIGAGDAFTAAMTDGFLKGLSLDKINREANRIGAFVASKTGAMPDFESFA